MIEEQKLLELSRRELEKLKEERLVCLNWDGDPPYPWFPFAAILYFINVARCECLEQLIRQLDWKIRYPGEA